MIPNKWIRSSLPFLLVIVGMAGYFYFSQPAQPMTVIPISKLGQDVQLGAVKKISVNGTLLNVTYRDGAAATSAKSTADGSIEATLGNLSVSPDRIAGVDITYEQPSQWSNILPLLIGFLPLILIGALLFYMLRRAQGGNNQVMSFGKSRARAISSEKPTVTFADVAGVDEAKQELQEVVEFLKEPEKFTALGARIPRGVLLVGAPGTGKTLMARAVAGEANVPFYSISGSEFVEMFVGVGASRVRDLFDTAKKNSPCLVFVDEIDAVGRHRGAGVGGSADEREQTLNQILVEMDGFDTDTHVIIVAATNRPDILDPALLRPGRFDRRVILDRPDMNGRKQILEVHTKGKPVSDEVDLGAIAKLTPGFSGADIENLVNEAAILAARREKKATGMDELRESIEKVIAGPERKSRLVIEEEKRILAFHEAGHALVMQMLPNCDPVYKVSIISRGTALGYTMHLPEDDRYLQRRSKFMDDLAGVLGGRTAEEIVFGDTTTGASGDLESATNLARAMVMRYGMSEALGPRTFGAHEEMVFLGREISEQRNYGEQVARQIDEEIKWIITTAHAKAKEVLTTYRNALDAIANRLILVETIDGAELAKLAQRPEVALIPVLVNTPVPIG
ncbi:MAG: ATP-dependent zinc metalloprotease FtsH [Chloroflexota bacterium]|nr:ATP-dependent zinc metalloprotease FtsH [Chloroflexota bacterium]